MLASSISSGILMEEDAGLFLACQIILSQRSFISKMISSRRLAMDSRS